MSLYEQRSHLSHFLLTVAVGTAEADEIAAELWSLGAVGIEELSGGLRAAFTESDQAERARLALAPDEPVEVIGDQYGLDAARDLLRVERAGLFAVHPPWLEPPPDAQSIVIDPGHAFGSGSHVSTRLALALLGDEIETGHRVFDVGCGTGVLSIGAALLGASVTAVDIEPAAIEATMANAERNDVEDRVQPILGSADLITDPVDLVLVNVTIDIHEAIAPALSRAHPRLLVAGLLGADQLDRCASAHHSSIVRSITDDGWMAAVLARS